MNRIKQLRQNKNETLEHVAKDVGLSTATIGQYEHGTREPRLQTWELLADHFGVSLPYLMGFGYNDVPPINGVSSGLLDKLVSAAKQLGRQELYLEVIEARPVSVESNIDRADAKYKIQHLEDEISGYIDAMQEGE